MYIKYIPKIGMFYTCARVDALNTLAASTSVSILVKSYTLARSRQMLNTMHSGNGTAIQKFIP